MPRIFQEAEAAIAEGFPSKEQVLVAVSQLQFFCESKPIDSGVLAHYFVTNTKPPTTGNTIPLVILAPPDTPIALHESTRRELIVVPVADSNGQTSHVLSFCHNSVRSQAGKLQGDASGWNAVVMKHHANANGTGGYSIMDVCVVNNSGGLYEGNTTLDNAFIVMFVGVDVSHPRLTSLSRAKPLNLGAAVVVNAPIE